MDMIVTSRTCRYRDREYKKGETINDVLPNHAKVLEVLRKAEPIAPTPVGKVAQTAPLPEPVADVADVEPVAEDPAEDDAAPRRARRQYQRRDLRAED